MSALEIDAPRGFVPKAEHYRALAEIDRLKDELAAIKGDAKVQDNTAFEQNLSLRFKLPPQAARVLAYMLRAPNLLPVVPCETLRDVADCPTCEQVGVIVWRIHKTLGAFGAPKILDGRQGWGGGRWVTPEGRAWLRERMPEFLEQGASR